MTTALSSSQKPRYWVEPFIEIVLGIAPADSLEQFAPLTDTLLRFRRTGYEPVPKLLENTEFTEEMITEFYETYLSLKEVTDIDQRVIAISQTALMSLVSDDNPAAFDDEESAYLEETGLPGALWGGSKEYAPTILKVENARDLALKCLRAFTKPEFIKHNVDAQRGLTKGEKDSLRAERAKAASWYEAYKNVDLDAAHRPRKSDIETMRSLIVDVNKQILADPAFKPEVPEELHPSLKDSFQLYIDLGMTFRELDRVKGLAIGRDSTPVRREEAYWLSVISNLATFLDRATE